jgi:hypothetical protein
MDPMIVTSRPSTPMVELVAQNKRLTRRATRTSNAFHMTFQTSVCAPWNKFHASPVRERGSLVDLL